MSFVPAKSTLNKVCTFDGCGVFPVSVCQIFSEHFNMNIWSALGLFMSLVSRPQALPDCENFAESVNIETYCCEVVSTCAVAYGVDCQFISQVLKSMEILQC